MAAYNRRSGVNRRRRRRSSGRFDRRYALPFFALASLLVGLLVFGIFSTCRREEDAIADVSGLSGQNAIAAAPTETVSATTMSTDEFNEPTEYEPEPDDIEEYDKQVPPSSVSYASEMSSSVSLGDAVDCESVILIDVSENTVVAAKSPDKRIYPASLTKVMTLITAYDYVTDPYTERFTMTQEILEPLITSGNSLAGFEVGEESPLIDYMYGMIMFSGADAAEAIAVHCCGSVDAFVNAMNRKAENIGLKNSHFTNPVGTHDDNHYSTVHDMALILGYAYEVDILAEILSTYKYTTSATDKHPEGLYFESNLEQRMKGDESGTCEVLGGKTGYTGEARHCVVAYACSNKTGKAYLFAAADGAAMYDPIWDCINTLKDYVE